MQENLVHGRYTPPEKQVEKFWRRNRSRGWGFPPDAIGRLASPPPFTSDPEVAVTLFGLFPTHERGDIRAGSTLNELKLWATPWGAEEAWNVINDAPFPGGAPFMLQGVDLIPGHLHWVRIKFDANPMGDVSVLANPRTSPGLELFATFALHPGYLRNMAIGMGMWVPGLRLFGSWRAQGKSATLMLHRGSMDRHPTFHVSMIDGIPKDAVVPEMEIFG